MMDAGEGHEPTGGYDMADILGAEAFLCMLVLTGGVGAEFAILLHGVWSALLLAACTSAMRHGPAKSRRMLLIASTALLGPIGAAGGALTYAVGRLLAPHTPSFGDWYASLFPHAEADTVGRLYDQIAIRGAAADRNAAAVASFRDILAGGTIEQKRQVLSLIADHFRPAFAPALQEALIDKEPTIRVQAASAIAVIENRFLDGHMQRHAACARSPSDVPLRLDLAQHQKAYAEAGLLDDDRRRHALQRALSLYESSVNSLDANAVVAMGDTLLQLGRPREAMTLLKPLISQPGSSETFAACYLRCLYELGLYGRLRSEAARLESQTQRQAGECMNVWAGAGSRPRLRSAR
jgi:hypothetical protein